VLERGSDTGLPGDDITSIRSPVFDVSGIEPGATLLLLRDGAVVASHPDTPGGTVAIGDPGPLLNGQHSYTAVQGGSTGNLSAPSAPLSLSVVAVPGDYVDSGTAQLAVARRVNAGELDTLIAGGVIPPGGSSGFGAGALDIPFQGDLDGDGKTDLILYRPSTSTWFVQQSSAGFAEYQFGGPGDIPVVGDFLGLGRDELAVYRPSTSQWFVGGYAGVFTTFGGPGDIPIALRNYYGSGKDVLAVFRPSTAEWFVAGQAGGISFGGVGDIPVTLYNYAGNGRDDLAVFRPSTAQWFPGGLGYGISFGGPGDIPVTLDYDGIGQGELGVYRPSTGQWFIGGHKDPVVSFGGPSDIPLSAPFAYRTLPGTYGSISAAPDVSVASTGTLDFGVSAAALPARPAFSPLIAPNPAASISPPGSTAIGSMTQTSVGQSATQGARPNQVVDSSLGVLPDFALASLQGFVKPRRILRLYK
jgi:hypothetical protein